MYELLGCRVQESNKQSACVSSVQDATRSGDSFVHSGRNSPWHDRNRPQVSYEESKKAESFDDGFCHARIENISSGSHDGRHLWSLCVTQSAADKSRVWKEIRIPAFLLPASRFAWLSAALLAPSQLSLCDRFAPTLGSACHPLRPPWQLSSLLRVPPPVSEKPGAPGWMGTGLPPLAVSMMAKQRKKMLWIRAKNRDLNQRKQN